MRRGEVIVRRKKAGFEDCAGRFAKQLSVGRDRLTDFFVKSLLFCFLARHRVYGHAVKIRFFQKSKSEFAVNRHVFFVVRFKIYR